MATLRDEGFVQSLELQLLSLSLVLAVSTPISFALLAPSCYAAHNAARLLKSTVVVRLPSAARDRLLWLVTDAGTANTLALAAIAEVLVALSAPLLLLTLGARTLVPLFLIARFICRRYKSSQYTRMAVDHMDTQMSGLFDHKWCPFMVKALWQRVRGLLVKLASRF